MIRLTKEDKDSIIASRRLFHMNPEPSLKEYETQKFIIEKLSKYGIKGTPIAGTGVIASIIGEKASNGQKTKTVALRADIDALEIIEQSDVAYKSQKEGLMHACGHDGHTAMLLGAAKALNENKGEFAGEVRLLFQPGEEALSGAQLMIEAGALKDVDAIYGQHLWNDAPVGVVNIEKGPRMASGDAVKIIFTGRGGHGSQPEACIDPIVVTSAFLLNAAAIISREKSPLNPGVFTIGNVKSGTRFNIIPERALVEGTIRCFDEETRQMMIKKVHQYAQGTAAIYDARAEVSVNEGTPSLINDEKLSTFGAKVAEAVVGKENIAELERKMGSEDMAYYFKEIPGTFAFIGSGFTSERETFPHHHPSFDIDENSLAIGAEMYINFAVSYLNE